MATADTRAGAGLDGAVAVVTGAGSGLGRAHALALAAAGARVVVNDIGGGSNDAPRAADRVVAEIESAGGEAIANHDSVAEAVKATALIDQAVDTWGRIDTVVNNAGILRDRTFAKMSLEELDAVLQVHLYGSIYVSQAAFRHMKDAGYGRLVHTTSGAGLFGAFGQLNYVVAKAGIIGLSRALAVEGAKYGVQSNCLAPLARTPLSGDIFGPMNDLLVPEAVSPLVVYLASPECTATGEVFSAGGGRFARAFTGLTRGWVAPGDPASITAADIEEHLDAIRDDTDFIVPRNSAEEVIQLLPEMLGLQAIAPS